MQQGCYGLNYGKIGFRFPAATKNAFVHNNETGCGSQSAADSLGAGNLFQGIKCPGRGTCYLPKSSAEFQSEWSHISAPPYIFMTFCFIKHSNNYTTPEFA